MMSERTLAGRGLDGGRNPDYLADAWQRLEWANSNGQAFDDLSQWFMDVGAYAIWVEHEGDRWQATFRRLCEPSIEQEKRTALALALGSFLDHSRAALNYTVYQLALLAIREEPALVSPDLPKRQQLRPETVEFPIVRKPEHFDSHSGIRNLPEKYRDFLKPKQPYHGEDQRLWKLNELAREYRHRLMHTIAISPVENLHHVLVNGQITPTPDMEIIPHERLEDGDVLLRFTLPGIEPDAHVQPQVVITVGIDHPLGRGIVGTGVLNDIRAVVAAVINEVEAEFFEP
jgi:hypothetical protein